MVEFRDIKVEKDTIASPAQIAVARFVSDLEALLAKHKIKELSAAQSGYPEGAPLIEAEWEEPQMTCAFHAIFPAKEVPIK